ncbi:MAG: peptidase M16 domain-containing protein [Bacteroidetes bacterium]|nr:MAG: peptidase M16 domain-containing protein [Bacteroidota bacterium]
MTEKTDILRTAAPEILQVSDLKLLEPKALKLSNGIELFCFNDTTQQALRFDMVFDAGSAYQQKALVASTSTRMMREGSQKYSVGAINAKIDYHGAYLDLQTTKDQCYLSLYCLDKSLASMLPIVDNILKEPLFKERNFKIFNQRQKQDFMVSSRKNKHLANRIFTARLYGEGTTYGKVASEKDFDLLETADLKAFHESYLKPSGTKMVISGPITDKMIQQIEKHFGESWPESGIAADFEHTNQFHPESIFQSKEHSLQSAIMMGRPVMLRSHPDYFGFLVLNTILGGYFGSRLMANIREDKGYTYGINSMVSPLRKATGFTIATEVGIAVTKQTLQEIKNELNRLREELVSEQELTLVKNYLTGTYLRSLDGVYNQADKFRVTLESRSGMNYFVESLKAINAISSMELNRLAQLYLNPDEMVTVVVGAEG